MEIYLMVNISSNKHLILLKGEFARDNLHGVGIYNYKNGDKYEGF